MNLCFTVLNRSRLLCVFFFFNFFLYSCVSCYCGNISSSMLQIFYFYMGQKHVFILSNACLVQRRVGIFLRQRVTVHSDLCHNLRATSPQKCVFVKQNLNLVSLSFPCLTVLGESPACPYVFTLMRFSSREPHPSGFYDFILNYCGNYVITAVRAEKSNASFVALSLPRTLQVFFWRMPMKMHHVPVDNSTISTGKCAKTQGVQIPLGSFS